jgi:hypothetical protein
MSIQVWMTQSDWQVKACSYPSTTSNFTTQTRRDTIIWIVIDLHKKNFEALEVLNLRPVVGTWELAADHTHDSCT